jgi:chorismate lyase / 3-hydroxybenzoate synthase
VLELLTRLTSGQVSAAAVDVLGGACLGQPAAGIAPGWPLQAIFAPLLGSTATSLHEIWRSSAPCIAGHSEGIAWRRSGGVLYGVCEINEAEFSVGSEYSPLRAASQEAYRRIFRLLAAEGLPYLWRVWNYFADINGESYGLERYRQFNIGRQDAFLEFRRGATGNVPAACAIGLASGPLSIAFIAGEQAAMALENPRQVSAYHYPADYGPRSPTFSRATLACPPGQEILFVSGTASIFGHRTVHAGDAATQCREVLANIEAVVATANLHCRSAAFSLGELSYRVYVRHAADFSKVEEVLLARLGAAAEVVFVQADICRSDLLLEIEATTIHVLVG